LMAEKLEELEGVEAAVRREMTRHLLEGLVVAVLVGLRAQNFGALQGEVEERVQAAEGVVRLELETEY
jgi:hypothetical protein